MKIRYNVRSGNRPREVELNIDTAYYRTNIHTCINEEGIEEYEYDEKELTLEEYFRKIIPINQTITEETLGELSILFAAYQEQTDEAIAELSIALEEAINNV